MKQQGRHLALQRQEKPLGGEQALTVEEKARQQADILKDIISKLIVRAKNGQLSDDAKRQALSITTWFEKLADHRTQVTQKNLEELKAKVEEARQI